MTKKELLKSLDYVNHSREKRMMMAKLVSDNPSLTPLLLEIAVEDNTHVSSKACWVLEFTAKENLSYIFPHIDVFTSFIGKLKLDSSIRPMAKICEYLIIRYFKKKDENIKRILKEHHLESITTTCFDWLIEDHKVATQAYSMTCLLLLGSKFDWIHPELKLLLEQNYASGSAAYKARARMTLARLK